MDETKATEFTFEDETRVRLSRIEDVIALLVRTSGHKDVVEGPMKVLNDELRARGAPESAFRLETVIKLMNSSPAT